MGTTNSNTKRMTGNILLKGNMSTNFLEPELLFTKSLNDEDIIVFMDIREIDILFLDKSAYIYNLRKLPYLKTIRIQDVNFIEFFDELSNLPHLKFISLYESRITLDPLYVIKSISKCNQITDIEIKINLTYIPDEISNMTNLKSLVFYNTDINYKFNEINKNLLKLKKLIFIEINSDLDFIENDNKMFIFNYKKSILISEKITELTICHCLDDLDNLPNNIEILNINSLTNYLTNLPISLTKLYIDSDELELLDENTGKYIVKNITEDDLKIPFGCDIKINKHHIIDFNELGAIKTITAKIYK
jgi:hypothetical protein